MDAFIGEIRPFAFGYVPVGWLPCDGSTYLVQQYQALYAVINNIYGGTAPQNFQTPNLTGLGLVGAGQGAGLSAYNVGQKAGATTVTITDPAMIAPHSHGFNGATSSTNRVSTPADAVSYLTNFSYTSPSGAATATLGYVANPPTPPDTALNQATIGMTGSTPQPHDNRQPTLAIIYAICFDGTYPIKP